MSRFSQLPAFAFALVAAVALAGPACFAPLAAQEASVRRPSIPASVLQAPPFPDASPAAEHADLAAAMREGADVNTALDAVIDGMAEAWRADPGMAQLEARSPGVLQEAASSTRPILARHMKRVHALYQPKIAAVLARYLTPAEAASMAQFYRSEAGLRLSYLLSRNVSVSAALEAPFDGSMLTRDQFDRDSAAMLSDTFGQMSADDMADLRRAIAAFPVMRKVATFAEPLRRVHLAAENEPMSKEDERDAEEALTAVFEKRLR